MRTFRREAVVLAVIMALCAAKQSLASVLYEDVFYWTPSGTYTNPGTPPLDAYVKIQETVFDDTQGKSILTTKLGLTIHGDPIPAAAIDLYCYSISNLGYDNGPFSGVGFGITGFNIVNTYGVTILGIWGPNAANTWWDVPAGNSGPGNFEWDIDGNMNGFDGDGAGILLGDTFDSFCVAVAAGTPHGLSDGHWVHTWTGGGADEQPIAVQADLVYGTLSLPIPEPNTMALVGLGIVGLLALARRQRK